MKSSFKKIIATVCFMAALLPLMVYAAQHLPHIQAEPSVGTVTAGEEFTVTVNSRSMQVASYTGGITFDTSMLEAVEIIQGTAPIFQNAVCGLSTMAEANASGRVGLYAIHSAEARYDAGTLMTVRFRAKATGTAILTPDENCDGTDAFWADAGRAEVCISPAAAETVSLTWRVVATGCDLTLRQGEDAVWSQTQALPGDYFVPVVPGPYTLEVARKGDYTRLYSVDTASNTDVGEVCPLPWGDVNGSGETDAVDLQTLFEYLSSGTAGGTLNAEQFAAVADANGDGAINILDYQALYEEVSVGGVVTVDTPLLFVEYTTPTETETMNATPTDTEIGEEGE